MVLSLTCTISFSQKHTQTTATIQQQRNEIHLDQVPEVIAKALAEDFKGYSVGKVFTSSQGEKYIYIIQLAKDGKAIEINYTTEGKMIN